MDAERYELVKKELSKLSEDKLPVGFGFDDIVEHMIGQPGISEWRSHYADFMEKKGQHKFAKFIRIGIAKDRVSRSYNLNHNSDIPLGFKVLDERDAELSVNISAWFPDLEIYRTRDRASFDFFMGFPSKAHCTMDFWLRHGPDLVSKYPIVSVGITDKHPLNDVGWACALTASGHRANCAALPGPIFINLPSEPLIDVSTISIVEYSDPWTELAEACLAYAKSIAAAIKAGIAGTHNAARPIELADVIDASKDSLRIEHVFYDSDNRTIYVDVDKRAQARDINCLVSLVWPFTVNLH